MFPHESSSATPPAVQYVGPPHRQPAARILYEVRAALQECFAQRIGKSGAWKFRYGEATGVDALFTESGEYLSHTMTSDSSSGRLVPTLSKLVRKMRCPLPEPSAEKISADVHPPYYRMRFGIGDPAVKEKRRVTRQESGGNHDDM